MALLLNDILFVGISGCVTALRKKTGEKIWETLIGYYPHQLCVERERVYVAMQGGDLYVLSAQTGEVLKKGSFPGTGQNPTLLVEDGMVFVTAGGELTAFDLDGNQQWTNPFKGHGNNVVTLATTTKDRQGDES